MDTRPGREEDVRGRTTFGRAVDIADGNFGAGRERDVQGGSTPS